MAKFEMALNLQLAYPAGSNGFDGGAGEAKDRMR